MNKNLKITLIVLNAGMLVLSGLWFYRDRDFEPMLAIGGQFVTLLCTIFDKQAANILTQGTTNNSKVKVRANSGDNIQTFNTDNDSEVDIDTK